ncbi:Oxoglutarate/iron-dependent dioxygenase [Parasponia andersonii]|uniref:Oxoglutarate/iron-dependent dioxygenase n=1 Tax=Parasponia andersonii TaxID=3476 RepID=A0A2P5CNL3_PARAD|nr:Oxoglutarate/iron-dependent dioxygenase [Parasponia andersonii]
MEKLLSTKTDLKIVPKSYILPPDSRLGSIKLTNHGVPEKLLQDVLDVTEEFLKLSAEDKAIAFSEDPKQSCGLYTSIDYMKEQVVGSYSVEVRKLSLCLLDLIGKGLGLVPGYFQDKTELTEVQIMSTAHCPPCPDPSLTLGLPKHSDVNLVTLVLQEVEDLQVLKDGQWHTIKPLPNAFVVNIGYTLQNISNGKLRSVEHRVVTNQKVARTSVASFILPSNSCQIEPAKVLIKDTSPPLYNGFTFKDFMGTYIEDIHQKKPPLERYKLQV